MPIDLAKLMMHEEVERSKRGDHGRLIELLRSEEPLPWGVRDYLANELEKGPRQRFKRQSQRDYDVERRDREILMYVAHAKLRIATRIICEALEAELIPMPPDMLGGLASPDVHHVRWKHVSNSRALDWLAEAEGMPYEIHADDLNNAINRRKRDKRDWERVKQRPLLTFSTG